MRWAMLFSAVLVACGGSGAGSGGGVDAGVGGAGGGSAGRRRTAVGRMPAVARHAFPGSR